jgi:hypothetical protein
MTGLRRVLAIALASALLPGFGAGAAVAAAPSATFVTPVPGAITVVQSGSYQVSWTIAEGTSVSAARLAVQASRPVGIEGCDPRWAPFSVQAVTGTSADVDGLALDRCYRFVLLLTIDGGVESVASSPIVPTSGDWGPSIEFVNPYVDGVVSYATSARVMWIESDTFGSPITSRVLVEQSAPANGDGCSGVSWSAGAALSFSGTGVNRALERDRCYRYTLAEQDAAGFRQVRVSGALRVVAELPEWEGNLNLFRDGAFVSQVTMTQCVAASSQMMLNLILETSDTSRATQAMYMAYAQANDMVTYRDGGSNPAGWAAALNRYGGAVYSVGKYIDSGSAIRAAVTRLRVTNRPVGLLVFRGRHAWVLNGFEATADPAVTSNFTVTAVYVTGPLYPREPNSYGYDQPPNTRLTVNQFTTSYFWRYYDSSLTTWNNYWVIVQP